VKMVFFLIIFFVLNLTTTVPSTEFCGGWRANLSLLKGLRFSSCGLPHHPHIVIRSVWPAAIVLGKVVEDSLSRLAKRPLGNINSTNTTEQSFEPALLTNNSNLTVTTAGEISIKHFWVSNTWGLARFGQRAFIAATPLRKASAVNAAPDTKPFQNDQSNTEIPSEYIFHQWAFFVLAIWGYFISSGSQFVIFFYSPLLNIITNIMNSFSNCLLMFSSQHHRTEVIGKTD
jgi:hypothetical protein